MTEPRPEMIVVHGCPPLPKGVDRSEFETDEQGRLITDYRAANAGEWLYLNRHYHKATNHHSTCSDVLRRKQPQPAQWTPPKCLQGEEWRGWTVKAVSRVQQCHDIQLTSSPDDYDGEWGLVCMGKLTWPAKLLKLTLDDFDGLHPGESIALGPQPKLAWKCTGKFAGNGAVLTHCNNYGWELWMDSPVSVGTYWDGMEPISRQSSAGWTWFETLIGPLPEVEGVPVEERIWVL